MLQNYIIQFDIKTQTSQDISLDALTPYSENNTLIYWIHVDLNNKDYFNKMAHQLNFPDDLIDLCENKENLPKLIENNESLALSTVCVLDTTLNIHNEPSYGNLVIYLTQQFCFTASYKTIPAVLEFKNSFHKYLNFAKTPCFILFLIMDNAITEYSKLLLNFELLADQIDLEVRDTETLNYNQVMAIKKQVIRVQHHLASLRDMLMRMSGRMITVISKACRLSLLNLLDHTKITFNEAEAIRDNLKNTLDQLDNSLMQRLNKTMRILTAFNAIFLPVSLIAVIYGMLPKVKWEYGYLGTLSLMLVCGVSLFVIFKLKKWF